VFATVSAPQVENIPQWGKNILRKGKPAVNIFGRREGGQKYTNYNKINNNSENFRGLRFYWFRNLLVHIKRV